MGLRSKWLDKKVNFKAFLEKMIDYILRELKNPRDIVSVVIDLKDPTINFKRNNLPRNLTALQLKSDVEVAIQKITQGFTSELASLLYYMETNCNKCSELAL